MTTAKLIKQRMLFSIHIVCINFFFIFKFFLTLLNCWVRWRFAAHFILHWHLGNSDVK